MASISSLSSRQKSRTNISDKPHLSSRTHDILPRNFPLVPVVWDFKLIMHVVGFYQRAVDALRGTCLHAARLTVYMVFLSWWLAWKQRSCTGTFHACQATPRENSTPPSSPNHSDTELIRAKTTSENKTQFSNVFTDVGATELKCVQGWMPAVS